MLKTLLHVVRVERVFNTWTHFCQGLMFFYIIEELIIRPFYKILDRILLVKKINMLMHALLFLPLAKKRSGKQQEMASAAYSQVRWTPFFLSLSCVHVARRPRLFFLTKSNQILIFFPAIMFVANQHRNEMPHFAVITAHHFMQH